MRTTILRPGITILVLGWLSFGSAASSGGAEPYWPGWLGPERDGWVANFQAPDAWPAQLHQKWQVEVGTGYGSPLVAEGRVYQHARQGDEEVIRCLDLETGSIHWRASYRAPFKIGGGGERHGKGPKSSPVLSDGRLFVMSITGTLYAWNARTGKLLWRRNYDEQFGKSHPYWGASTSPIVYEDRVIVHFGTDERGALIAMDVRTGQEIWKSGDDGPSYSSPLIPEIAGVRQVIEWNHRALVGVDVGTGRKLWEHEFPHEGSNQNMPTPAIHGNRILLGGENRGLVCLEPTLRNDEWSVQEHWFQDDVALDMSSAVVNDDLLFGLSHYGRGRYFCLDIDTGEVLWEGPGRTADNVMFLSIPGHIIALLDHGQLQILKASGESYQKLVSYRVSDAPSWAPPVLLPDGFLVKDDRHLTYWSFTK